MFDQNNPMQSMVMQHLLGPGGTQQGPLGPGGTQQLPMMNLSHLLGPGGTQQPQSPYSQTDSYPGSTQQNTQQMNVQHLIGPGGNYNPSYQHQLGPGGTYNPSYQHNIGPGGTQNPWGAFSSFIQRMMNDIFHHGNQPTHLSGGSMPGTQPMQPSNNGFISDLISRV